MNPQQAAFLRQARSDWEMFQLFRQRQPVCHQLHFLQMATEKLAKAYLWGTRTPPRIAHASLVQFLRLVAHKGDVSAALEFHDQRNFHAWISSTIPLAAQVENLAPQLAGEGPNPEYPFPRTKPTIAPIDHDFSLAQDLSKHKGKTFIHSIGRLLETFPQWG
jgi:hypothetical protein